MTNKGFATYRKMPYNIVKGFVTKELNPLEYALLSAIFCYYPQDVKLTKVDIQKLLDIGEKKAKQIMSSLKKKGYTRYVETGRNRKGYYDFTSIPFEFVTNTLDKKTSALKEQSEHMKNLLNLYYTRCKTLKKSDKHTKLLSILLEKIRTHIENISKDEKYKDRIFINGKPLQLETRFIYHLCDLYLKEIKRHKYLLMANMGQICMQYETNFEKIQDNDYCEYNNHKIVLMLEKYRDSILWFNVYSKTKDKYDLGLLDEKENALAITLIERFEKEKPNLLVMNYKDFMDLEKSKAETQLRYKRSHVTSSLVAA